MCDTLIANRGMTACGYTIFGKNSDRNCNEPQYFVFIPAADHEEKEVKCTYIPVKQVRHTNAVLLSKPSWIWGAEMGINEYGVCIGNEAVFSRETRKAPALLGMDMIRLSLERSSAAGEAMQIMIELLETYGQGGNANFDGEFFYDNSFMIADADETWYLETAGPYWGARKVEGVFAISNHMILGNADLMHPEAVSHAAAFGYPTGEPFDFAGSYIDWARPNNISGFVRRASSQHMLELPGDRFDVRDMMRALRSHTTDDPWTKGDVSVCKHAVRFASESASTNSMIATLRPGDPAMWGTGMSTPCIAPYQPFWMDACGSRLVYAYADQEKAMDRWLKLEGINRAMVSGRIAEAVYRRELSQLQESWLQTAQTVDRADRQAFCEDTAVQAEAFFERWLKFSVMRNESYPDEAAAEYWKVKNKKLGINRTIAW